LKVSCCSSCLGRRLRRANTGDFGSRTGDSGPRLWGTFSRGVARPSNGGGGFFPLPQILWPESSQAQRLRNPRPETPVADHLARRLWSCKGGDFGLKKTATARSSQGLYKAFSYLKTRLRLTLFHLHCCQASKS
jgi:hypothetical protein